MKIWNIVLSAVVATQLVACANYVEQKQAANCFPGTQCYQQLPKNLQQAKRQQWLAQRQNQLQDQRQQRNGSLWAVKPVSEY
ncbi:MAG: hypothetical protein KIT27_05000 [Legionellales bacterium]|nr:hypothetical protein [Legionellales bacterium]